MSTDRPIPILIADDDPDDCLLVREAFAECRVRCPLHFVHDGEELMDYLTRRPPYSDSRRNPMPGLILLDLNMPRKDGWEALSEIRASRRLREIPVVIMTTSADKTDVSASYQAGVNSFITKPASYEHMLEVVHSLAKYWLEVVELPGKQDND